MLAGARQADLHQGRPEEGRRFAEPGAAAAVAAVATDAGGLVEDRTEPAVDLGRGADEHRFEVGVAGEEAGHLTRLQAGYRILEGGAGGVENGRGAAGKRLVVQGARGRGGAAVAAAAEKERGDGAGVLTAVHVT